MQDWINAFFHVINTTYLFGVPIDHFVHVIVCFALFLGFRAMGFKTYWCLIFIFLLGMGKIWYSWGAMIDNGRYENPPIKMFDNFVGAGLGYLVWRWRKSA